MRFHKGQFIIQYLYLLCENEDKVGSAIEDGHAQVGQTETDQDVVWHCSHLGMAYNNNQPSSSNQNIVFTRYDPDENNVDGDGHKQYRGEYDVPKHLE